MATRDAIRSAIFSDKKVAVEKIMFFGQEIELRQPILRQILAVQATEDRESVIVDTLIKYAFVPGTEEKVFEDGDAEQLLALPFGKDMLRVSTALTKLTDVDFLDTAKPSLTAPAST
jgi:hypothetical protein